MQIARLFETVYLLLNKKTTTAKELSERFEVSIRTIYRDIDVLSQAGIPIYTTKGKGGGISLMDHYVLNKSLLTTKEQEDILISLSSMQKMKYHDSDILQKLGSIFQKEIIDWIDVDFQDWRLYEREDKFNIIKNSILNTTLLSFRYSNQAGEDSIRVVEPLKLVFKGQAWYLFAYCTTKKDGRCFKLSRIKNLKCLDETFIRRDIQMDTTSYQKKNEMLLVHLKIAKSMAYRIYDEFDTLNIKQDNEFIYLTCEIFNHDESIDYLLSYGDKLEVLAPISLRNTMIDKISKMQNTYQ